jgi:hypothetical protein
VISSEYSISAQAFDSAWLLFLNLPAQAAVHPQHPPSPATCDQFWQVWLTYDFSKPLEICGVGAPPAGEPMTYCARMQTGQSGRPRYTQAWSGKRSIERIAKLSMRSTVFATRDKWANFFDRLAQRSGDAPDRSGPRNTSPTHALADCT